MVFLARELGGAQIVGSRLARPTVCNDVERNSKIDKPRTMAARTLRAESHAYAVNERKLYEHRYCEVV